MKVRVYKCRSPKCSWVWLRQGKKWTGPYWPHEGLCVTAGHNIIALSFGNYCDEAAKTRSKKDVKEMYGDCWSRLEMMS